MPIDDKTLLPFYKALIENSRDVVTLLDASGIIQFNSPSIEVLFGYGTAELVGTLVFDRVHPEDRELTRAILKDLLDKKNVPPFIVRFQHKNGSWLFIEVIAHFAEAIHGVMLSSRDVTEFEETSKARRLVDASFEAAFNASSALNSISVVGTGVLTNVNDGWLRAFGWSREEAIGKSALELNVWGNEENRVKTISALREKGSLRGFRVSVYTKSGETLTVLLDAAYLHLPVGTRLYISALDITEREQTEEKLRQSQRLDAIGHLTGGIAHDFNNLLSVIMGHAELAANEPGLTEQGVESLAAIERASVTGANLIQQLLSFSRKQHLLPTTFNFVEHLESMRPLLQTTIAKDINLEITSYRRDWYCCLDTHQFDNAILNMTINARDAMPEGGTLEFIIEEAILTEADVESQDLQVGEYIRLSVKDSGSGMSDEAKKHAFEPFYTTKQAKGGSGLGLSMVFGFVTQSGGRVDIEPGMDGTTISLLLPRVAEPSTMDSSDVPVELPQARNEKVLVVEDNTDVRALVVRLLKTLGFEVTEVGSGSEADALIQTQFDLLVCDLMLPGDQKGPDIAKNFIKAQPNVAVLYMSGYQQDILTAEDIEPALISFIQKPFSREDFASEVFKLMEHAGLAGSVEGPGR